jgi:hypothetical protein
VVVVSLLSMWRLKKQIIIVPLIGSMSNVNSGGICYLLVTLVRSLHGYIQLNSVHHDSLWQFWSWILELYLTVWNYLIIFYISYTRHIKHVFDGLVWFMVFNATFKNISVISWRPVLLVEETRVPGENHRPVASNWRTLLHNVVLSTPRHELTTLVVIGTDCTGSCKSNYHTITTVGNVYLILT